VTGGVVFLDEIADISHALQAKLLPVLSGGRFYLVGGEGDSTCERTFDGVVITATWQPVGPSLMRQDLLSRISAHVIEVPGIGARTDDLRPIVRGIQEFVIQRYRSLLEQMIHSDPAVDRGFWEAAIAALHPVSDEAVGRLAQVDWSCRSDMRGLVNAVERIVVGREDPARVVNDLPTFASPVLAEPDEGAALYSRLFDRASSGEGLLGHVKASQLAGRRALKDYLAADESRSARLARHLGIDERQLVDQVRQLDRSRTRRTRRGDRT
jgi:DNA-binding NtrC family response regulator